MQTPQADTRGNAASGAFSANGLRPAQNNYLLDGIDNNSNAVDFLNGTNFVILPPVDAIQEFKVQTADFSAELGRSAGAVLNATIKSGTNSLHGAAWEFFRNDVLDAADYFENNTGIKKGELRQNQFGVSVRRPDHQEQDLLLRRLRRLPPRAGHGRERQRADARWSAPATTRTCPMILALNDGTTRTDVLGPRHPEGHRSWILPPRVWSRRVPLIRCTGLVNNTGKDGYVRDPFGYTTCASPTSITSAGCSDLNQLPAKPHRPDSPYPS